MAIKGTEVISAVPVLFHEDGSLDLEANRNLFTHLRDAGIDAVFVGGTTGEFTALSDSERVAIFEQAVEVFGPDSTVAHVGATSAHQACELTRQARRLGINRIAAISPFFHPSDAERVLDYYRAIAAENGDGGLYAYTYTELTGVKVDPETLAKLAAIPGVIGTKVSAQPLTDLPGLIDSAPEGFQILWGNDGVFDEVHAGGGTGIVSGVSSVFPELFVEWAKALETDDEVTASSVGKKAKLAVESVSPGIGALKHGLKVRGFGSEVTRIPTALPTEEQKANIETQLAPYLPS